MFLKSKFYNEEPDIFHRTAHLGAEKASSSIDPVLAFQSTRHIRSVGSLCFYLSEKSFICPRVSWVE